MCRTIRHKPIFLLSFKSTKSMASPRICMNNKTGTRTTHVCRFLFLHSCCVATIVQPSQSIRRSWTLPLVWTGRCSLLGRRALQWWGELWSSSLISLSGFFVKCKLTSWCWVGGSVFSPVFVFWLICKSCSLYVWLRKNYRTDYHETWKLSFTLTDS